MDITNDNLRVFIAAPRSGSTLFMRIMANNPGVAVTSRNVLMGLMKPRESDQVRRDFQPDYSIFYDAHHPVYEQAMRLKKRIIVSKEELGNDRFTGTYDLNECNYPIFPDDESLIRSRPVFTFRDPLRVFDSWLARGWQDIDSFVICYKTLIESFTHAKNLYSDTVFYTYNYITENEKQRNAVFQTICAYWGIKFEPSMLEFTNEFGDNFVYATEREKKIYTEKNPKGIFNTVRNSQGILSNVPEHGLLTEAQRNRIIGSGLVDIYADIEQQCKNFYQNKVLFTKNIAHTSFDNTM